MSARAPQPLHLLRALLRECTYLPDENARRYAHKRVLRSFCAHCPPARVHISTAVQTRLLRRAGKELSFLRRANEGYLLPLTKVLLLTYGRVGARRHELLAPLLQQSVAQDKKALEELISKGDLDYGRNWSPPPAVTALMNSQAQHSGQIDEKLRPQRILQKPLKIPETNIWGRPMPRCRVRNATRRWYSNVLQSIFPPLPEPEWRMLRSLAWGEHPWTGPVTRRRRPQQDLSSDDQPPLTAELLTEGPSKSQTFTSFVNGRPHKIRPRLMRKLWGYVLAHTPLMRWNPSEAKWRIAWSAAEPDRPVVSNLSETRAALLFGDLSIKGKEGGNFHRQKA